jgi:hypothetical protein
MLTSIGTLLPKTSRTAAVSSSIYSRAFPGATTRLGLPHPARCPTHVPAGSFGAQSET